MPAPKVSRARLLMVDSKARGEGPEREYCYTVDIEGWKAKIKERCDSSLRYQRDIQLVKSGAVIDIVRFLIK
jgi:hypothetical protein